MMNNPNAQKNLKPFTKGDPRINRKGRPKSFDALRALSQQIAHEAALRNGEPLVIEGHIVTVTEAILRSWAQSKDPRLQMAFIEIAYGKVPNPVSITGADGGPLKIATDPKAIDRALSSLADAVGTIVPGAGSESESAVDAAEQPPMGGLIEPGG